MKDVIARYLDCWNQTDPAARRTLIDEVWAADAEYTDPIGAGTRPRRNRRDHRRGPAAVPRPGVQPGRTSRRAPQAGALHLGARP